MRYRYYSVDRYANNKTMRIINYLLKSISSPLIDA